MPWNPVAAATKQLQKAYRDLEKAKKKTDQIKKRWEKLLQQVFGLTGDDRHAASLMADVAETAYHDAQAEELEAQKKYHEALARQVKAALNAGLDR